MSEHSERSELLAAFDNLRVTDVRDGLDTVGLFHTGSMSPAIRPLWRTRGSGIARTARYVGYDGPMATKTGEEYWEWVGWYYQEVCPYPWMEDVQDGDFVVIDQSGLEVGLMGSNNSLEGVRRGVRGYVTNGGVRDTDEIILQKIPFWSERCVQPMVQVRLQFDAKDVPICVGGVTVSPGDVVVADGDGVVVVPRDVALDVAKYADAERRRDMAGRRRLYEALGMVLDDTVVDREETQS
ncbi:MAG: RraA family protein [Planctomycetota bacterium]|jgi:regulator of RNase E activity RraA